MSFIPVEHNPIIKELMAAGIIPPQCYQWSIEAQAGGVMTMKIETFLTEEQFRKIADIFLAHKDDPSLIQYHVITVPRP